MVNGQFNLISTAALWGGGGLANSREICTAETLIYIPEAFTTIADKRVSQMHEYRVSSSFNFVGSAA